MPPHESPPQRGDRPFEPARDPIDLFVRARLVTLSLAPSPAASRDELLRRVTFDLTGLPPTTDELDAFLADPRPDAWERVVDRLLASPRYGERMAVPWLDAARYADTHGYHIDSHRDMWRWRDWVIDALNQGMPFDQFTIEQLAGDLLPNATLEQRIATGFHRNHMINFEGGALPEEYLVEYIADRVTTTGTVWLGQTLECSRCHDHKHDPFTQREFYQLYAFFHQVPENGIDGKRGNAVPRVTAPTDAQREQLDRLDRDIRELEESLAQRGEAAEVAKAQAAWERSFVRDGPAAPGAADDAWFWLPCDERPDGRLAERISGQSSEIFGNGVFLDGKNGQAWLLDGDTHADFSAPPLAPTVRVLTLAGWVFPTTTDEMTLMALSRDGTRDDLTIWLDRGRLRVDIGHQGDESEISVQATKPLELRHWQHLVVAIDAREATVDVRVTVDGKTQAVEVQRGAAYTFRDLARIRVGADWESERSFRGMLDDLRLVPRALAGEEITELAGRSPIAELLAVPAPNRTTEQRRVVRDFYLKNVDPVARDIMANLTAARRRRETSEALLPTTMVMADGEPRETFVLERGDYRRQGERVEPAVPACLPPLPGDAPRNRLSLARWLVSPDHPLTARVTVNRLWQHFFGIGIVETAEDFGSRGESPTHPELLDAMALEFAGSQWDVKRVCRRIVSSATYRQTARASHASREQDPRNRFMARGPRHPLPAELVRDQALFVADLLVERLGGPAVQPYQPAGLWEELAYDPREYTAQTFKLGRGEELYRRSVYTFWKRTIPPPALEIFGAPNRESCVVRRARSDTPLRALVLMNDPTYLEASRALATRILRAQPSTDQRLAQAFRLVTSRKPTRAELTTLRNCLDDQLAEFRAHGDKVRQLLSIGASPVPEGIDPSQLAAWTTLANMLFGLDEAQ